MWAAFCINLSVVKENLAPIVLRAHSEVNPVGRAPLLLNQLIKVALRAIGDIQQYPRHPDHLLRPITMDIHRATRQMITPLRAPTLPIHLFRSKSAVDDDRNLIIISTYSFSPYSFSPIPIPLIIL